jgi:heptosyltransferase-2
MFVRQLLNSILKKLLSVPELTNKELGNVNSFLVIRQHNQLGDQLASVSFFRAIKEKYPDSRLTVIVSPENEAAIMKNKFIDKYFVFNKKKLYFMSYFIQLAKVLREGYDVVVVPVTVSISFTSNLLASLSKSKIKIGIKELNGKKNDFNFFFNYRITMDWRKHPDANVADFCLEMIRPFGINTSNFQSEINFDDADKMVADDFVQSLNKLGDELLIGLHVGAGKPPNRWSLDKFVELISLLDKKYKAKFYITGSSADKPELDYLLNRVTTPIGQFINKQIPEVAALVAESDLFITNDTGIMHVAGTTTTPQISLFGPTNPFNWAPNGKDKYFIRKSDLIDDINVEDVLILCENILTGENKT